MSRPPKTPDHSIPEAHLSIDLEVWGDVPDVSQLQMALVDEEDSAGI